MSRPLRGVSNSLKQDVEIQITIQLLRRQQPRKVYQYDNSMARQRYRAG